MLYSCTPGDYQTHTASTQLYNLLCCRAIYCIPNTHCFHSALQPPLLQSHLLHSQHTLLPLCFTTTFASEPSTAFPKTHCFHLALQTPLLQSHLLHFQHTLLPLCFTTIFASESSTAFPTNTASTLLYNHLCFRAIYCIPNTHCFHSALQPPLLQSHLLHSQQTLLPLCFTTTFAAEPSTAFPTHTASTLLYNHLCCRAIYCIPNTHFFHSALQPSLPQSHLLHSQQTLLPLCFTTTFASEPSTAFPTNTASTLLYSHLCFRAIYCIPNTHCFHSGLQPPLLQSHLLHSQHTLLPLCFTTTFAAEPSTAFPTHTASTLLYNHLCFRAIYCIPKTHCFHSALQPPLLQSHLLHSQHTLLPLCFTTTFASEPSTAFPTNTASTLLYSHLCFRAIYCIPNTHCFHSGLQPPLLQSHLLHSQHTLLPLCFTTTFAAEPSTAFPRHTASTQVYNHLCCRAIYCIPNTHCFHSALQPPLLQSHLLHSQHTLLPLCFTTTFAAEPSTAFPTHTASTLLYNHLCCRAIYCIPNTHCFHSGLQTPLLQSHLLHSQHALLPLCFTTTFASEPSTAFPTHTASTQVYKHLCCRAIYCIPNMHCFHSGLQPPLLQSHLLHSQHTLLPFRFT